LFRISVFALCALSAHGQTANTGAIAGTISDPSGALVADAAVVVNSQGTREERDLATDSEGNFSVPFLPPGDYDLTVRAPEQVELDFAPAPAAALSWFQSSAPPAKRRRVENPGDWACSSRRSYYRRDQSVPTMDGMPRAEREIVRVGDEIAWVTGAHTFMTMHAPPAGLGLFTSDEGAGPAAVGFDRLVDFGHQADGWRQ
jgi:hypothetical protein